MHGQFVETMIMLISQINSSTKWKWIRDKPIYFTNLLRGTCNSLMKWSPFDLKYYTASIDDGIEQVHHTIMTFFNKSSCQN